jgi:predicted DCC family thiol-disulfide oxidoreductase YuxK
MKNKILIYDDNCPLCTWYSGLFVKYNFLSAEGRKPFSKIEPAILSRIDFDKSRNEIPLVDTATGNVIYGIDALLEILDRKIPLIKRIGNIGPLNWFLKKLYKLVSFNRKVIVAKKCSTGSIDCTPDINYFYRFLFMFLSLAFNTFMLFPIQETVFSKLSYYNLSIGQLQLAHFALVGVNCLLTFSFNKPKAYEYLGQVNMLALSVILILIPLMLLQNFEMPQWFITIYLIGTTTYIFKEYFRRMTYAGVLPGNKWIAGINMVCLSIFIYILFY